MKRVIFLFLLFLSFQLGANANISGYYCPKEQYNLSGSFSSFISNISGSNFITKQLIEKIIIKVLKEELNSTFNVELKIFDNNNLMNGKFKSLNIFGKNIERNGLHLSAVSASTLCNYNHIKYKNNKLYFLENMVVGYSARITEEDLKKTLQTNEYISFIKNAQITSGNTVLAKISDVDISIKNNKLIITSKILIPVLFGSIPNEIKITSGLNVENGKIKFDDIHTENTFLNIAIQTLTPLLDKINPFTYTVQTKDKYDIILRVENVKIENNEIFTDGIVVILKNYNK